MGKQYKIIAGVVGVMFFLLMFFNISNENLSQQEQILENYKYLLEVKTELVETQKELEIMSLKMDVMVSTIEDLQREIEELKFNELNDLNESEDKDSESKDFPEFEVPDEKFLDNSLDIQMISTATCSNS